VSLYGAAGNVFGVAFSPDGRYLATANGDGTVRIFTLEPDELIALAHERVQRTLTDEECRTYLHTESCP
jgi:WD40 repeat protein